MVNPPLTAFIRTDLSLLNYWVNHKMWTMTLTMTNSNCLSCFSSSKISPLGSFHYATKITSWHRPHINFCFSYVIFSSGTFSLQLSGWISNICDSGSSLIQHQTVYPHTPFMVISPFHIGRSRPCTCWSWRVMFLKMKMTENQNKSETKLSRQSK